MALLRKRTHNERNEASPGLVLAEFRLGGRLALPVSEGVRNAHAPGRHDATMMKNTARDMKPERTCCGTTHIVLKTQPRQR